MVPKGMVHYVFVFNFELKFLTSVFGQVSWKMSGESAERQSDSVIIASFLIEHSSWPIREQEIVHLL